MHNLLGFHLFCYRFDHCSAGLGRYVAHSYWHIQLERCEVRHSSLKACHVQRARKRWAAKYSCRVHPMPTSLVDHDLDKNQARQTVLDASPPFTLLPSSWARYSKFPQLLAPV